MGYLNQFLWWQFLESHGFWFQGHFLGGDWCFSWTNHLGCGFFDSWGNCCFWWGYHFCCFDWSCNLGSNSWNFSWWADNSWCCFNYWSGGSCGNFLWNLSFKFRLCLCLDIISFFIFWFIIKAELQF